MINLFPKRVARTVRAPEAQSMSTAALLPTVMMSTDRDFNLIRVVTDHGPDRIAQITERLERMAGDAIRLERERSAIERLLSVLSEGAE